MSKRFIFDRIVDRENICNFQKEFELIMTKIMNKNNVVFFGPRNFGKTSLVKNVIIEEFKKKTQLPFVFFVDLYEVKDEQSLLIRLIRALEATIKNYMPVKSLINLVKEKLTSFEVSINVDSFSGSPVLSLNPKEKNIPQSIYQIFKVLKETALNRECLIVMDEFQDISFIKGIQGEMRDILQNIGDIPVIIMGSKQHLLADIFSNPQSPMYSWGYCLEIKPIPYQEYHHYIQERFNPNKIKISEEISKHLQDVLHRVPESINILCQEIIEHYKDVEIKDEHVNSMLDSVLQSRESIFEKYVALFSINEEKILIEVAKNKKLKEPQSHEFIVQTGLSHGTIATLIKKLINKSTLECINGIYRHTDPLLELYLQKYR